MQHRRWLLTLTLILVCSATTTVWGFSLPFTATSEMTLTPGSGYNNQINVYLKQSIASGNTSTGTSGSYMLELRGNVDTVTNAVSLTGMGFVKRPGTGLISADDFTVSMLFGSVLVKFTGLKADLNTPVDLRPLAVSGGSSYGTTGSQFLMNDGSYVISGLSGGSRNFATSPETVSLLARTGSLTVGSVFKLGDMIHFTTTAIVPVATDTTDSGGTQTKITGNLRSVGEFIVEVPEPGTMAMALSLTLGLAGYGWVKRRIGG